MDLREHEFLNLNDELPLPDELEKPPAEFDTAAVVFMKKSGKSTKKMIVFITSILAAVGINCGVLSGAAQTAAGDNDPVLNEQEYPSAAESAENDSSFQKLFLNEGGMCRLVFYNEIPSDGDTTDTEVFLETDIKESELKGFDLPQPNECSGYEFDGWCIICKEGGFIYVLRDDGLSSDNILRIPVHDGLRLIELHAMWTLNDSEH